MQFTRRQVLNLLASTGALVALRPRLFAIVRTAVSPEGGYGFLTAEELTILDAAAATVLPTDARSGAREIGVVDYIQSLLSFMPGADANCDERVNAADIAAVARKATGHADGCPNGDVDGDASVDDLDVSAAAAATFRARPVFGGGPFSGRNPQPHFPVGSTPCQTCHGATAVGESEAVPRGGSADVYPPNAFALFLPLNRLQRLSWRIRLLGADAVPEAAGNPLARESLEVDLRGTYRRGLAAVEDKSQRTLGTAFVALPPAQQMEILSTADAVFYQVLQRHVIDGTLCAPEYGGNRDRLGWQLAGFDGDSQPLGYAIYDPAVPGHYRERPDKPNFGPNPNERCAPFSEGQSRFLDLLTRIAQPGGHFTTPYCFEVEE